MANMLNAVKAQACLARSLGVVHARYIYMDIVYVYGYCMYVYSGFQDRGASDPFARYLRKNSISAVSQHRKKKANHSR